MHPREGLPLRGAAAGGRGPSRSQASHVLGVSVPFQSRPTDEPPLFPQTPHNLGDTMAFPPSHPHSVLRPLTYLLAMPYTYIPSRTTLAQSLWWGSPPLLIHRHPHPRFCGPQLNPRRRVWHASLLPSHLPDSCVRVQPLFSTVSLQPVTWPPFFVLPHSPTQATLQRPGLSFS